jgi:hypothetical protein
MLDDQPWFRRWFGFAYLPIKWQGWVAIFAFLIVELPLMRLSLDANGGSPTWWVLAAGGIGLFLGFWAFVERKTESS